VGLQPQYDRTKVLVGQAQMYLQDYNSTSPATLPADTVMLGTSWTTSMPLWLPAGASDSGLELDFQRKPNDVFVEEQATPVVELSDTVAIGVKITLSQDSFQTMRWALGGGTITEIAPGVGQPGVEVLVVPTDMANFSLGFEGQNEFGFWRRVLLQPCTSVGTLAVAFRRSKDKRMYATQFNYLDKLENMGIRQMTAVATG